MTKASLRMVRQESKINTTDATSGKDTRGTVMALIAFLAIGYLVGGPIGMIVGVVMASIYLRERKD